MHTLKFKLVGLVQAYTLECNFNTGRVVNCVPMASRDSGRATPPPPGTSTPDNPSIPKYNPDIYEEAGKAMAISILDLTEVNPWTRLTCSACKNVKGVKEWLRKFIRHSEEQHNHKTPTKSQKAGGNYNSHTSSNLVMSPTRSMRSGSGNSRRTRTFSATSLSGSNISHSHNAGSSANSSTKWAGGSAGKKLSRGSGPSSPGSYRPVSKIARKNSLNQQQSQSPASFRIDLSSLPSVDSDITTGKITRPKLSRSKSLTGPFSFQVEHGATILNKKMMNAKETNTTTSAHKIPINSNDTPGNSNTDASRSRSRSKGRASKPTRKQRSPVDKQIPIMKWSHNGTLITHSLPPPQIKKTNSNKNRSLSANQKKRRITNLDKSTSSLSLNLAEVPSRSQNIVTKNGQRKNSNASSSSSTQPPITNIRATTSIDVEKQILSLTGDTHSNESSVLGSTYASSETKDVSNSSSYSSGIGSSSTIRNTPKISAPKPTKKRRIKRKKAT